ncbi:MAG: phosphoribosylformylglycinamidine synthase subunit PurQ [Candidatus Omnitrophica bacterium]|nr:phosphoribosylformylglycinamidine synthase subunit PurQ [Candidatus Omnitrophota bacterium]
MRPKALVLRTAGTNCDKETTFAFKTAGAQADLYHINAIKETNNLSDYQIICIPGGFSYGDDLGAGKILSLELMLWLRDSIGKFIDKGGLMLGICNGFQVLVKTGILPDLDFKQKVTLTDNDSRRFEDRWVYLQKPETSNQKPERREENSERREARGEREKKPEDIWLRGMPEVFALPVAHGEGKFYAQEAVLDKIEKNNQVALRYVNKEGATGSFPVNPNGSLNDIAGITDSTGKILGLMPHPERFMFKHQWPFWQQEDTVPFGLKIFQNAVSYFSG